MDFSILYVLQHLHNAVLDRVMVGITHLEMRDGSGLR